MHALDCLLQRTQKDRHRERKVVCIRERARRAGPGERERVKVKSPFECNDFSGKKNNTHTHQIFVRV